MKIKNFSIVKSIKITANNARFDIKQVVRLGFVALLFSLASFKATASTLRHVLWDKVPIEIQLPIGAEKIITFPGEIQPYLPVDLLESGALTSINNHGTLYLKATKPFSEKMAEIKLQNNAGDVVLLNLSASRQANSDQLSVLLQNHSVFGRRNLDSSGGATQTLNQAKNEDRSLGLMVRFVAQQLYAPLRLLTQPSWIARTPMYTQRFVDLYRGGAVSAMPLSSWRANDYYITAILLRNVLKSQKVLLTHQMLRGNWIAVSFFREGHLSSALLTPARTDADTTTAIFVSSVPFTQALKEGYNNV